MTESAREKRGAFRPLWFLAVATLVALGANAHLLYVALSTQPECVDHLKVKGDAPGQYRAANSAC